MAFETFIANLSATSGGAVVGSSPGYNINEVPETLAVVKWEPSNGSTDINITTNKVTLTFNRPVKKGTGTITIRQDSTSGTVVETITNIGSTPSNVNIFNSYMVASTSGINVVITLSNPLKAGTKYCFSFPSGLFTDESGLSWAGSNSYDFSVASEAVIAAPTITASPSITESSPVIEASTVSGSTSAVVTAVNVTDYTLDFTTATGECGIDITNAYSKPTAFHIFWDGGINPVAGTGGTADKPTYLSMIGNISTKDIATWQKRVGNGTIQFLDKNKTPSVTNPFSLRFNKTKADPQRATLRVYTFGATTWEQVMPPSVTVVAGKAKFALLATDKTKQTFTPPKIDGNTGFAHFSESSFWKDVLTEPLNSTQNAKHFGTGTGYKNWKTLNADGTPKYVNLGDGFLQFPSGNHNTTFAIENSGTGAGTVTGVTITQSNDQLLAPGYGSSWGNAFTTSVSNLRIAKKNVAISKSTPVTGFPVTLNVGYKLYFDVTVNWPYTYYSPSFSWTAQTGKSAPTVGDVVSSANKKTILANFKTSVIDPLTKLRTNLLRFEVAPNYTNAEYIPPSADIRVLSSKSGIVTADPLAQTFFIQSNEYPDGMFISSVDLFFKTKATTEDVTVQIRPVVNGYPSSADIVPFAISSLPSSAINVTTYPDSTNSSSYTKFKFDTPVYLAPGTYAIVILSPSKDYEVFTATVGGFQLDDLDTRIAEIPYAGDLFKSSNSQTWLPSPYQDLCFVLNRAEFKSSGVAQFISDKPPSNYSSRYNTFSPVTHYNKGQYIRVEASTNTDNIYEVLSSGTSGATAPTHTTGDVANGLITLRFLATGERWQDTVIPYDVYFAQGENLTFKNSEAKYYYKGTNESGILDTDFNQIMLGSNYELESRKALDSNVKDLYSKVDLTTSDPKISPVVDVTRLSSVLVRNIINNDLIAPDFIANTAVKAGDYIKVFSNNVYRMYLIIDSGTTSIEAPMFDGSDALNGTALLRFVGTTHNGDTELLPAGGMAQARYMTRKVVLADGFESTDIVTRFNAVTPTGSTVKVYYKAAFVDGNNTLEQAPYHEMVLAERASGYDKGFVEHKFVCDYGDNALPGVRYALPNKKRFNQFSIKIVMLSATTVTVPKVRDLRVMALDD